MAVSEALEDRVPALGLAHSAQAEIQTQKEIAREELAALQARILSGEESTGDRLTDGLVALYGTSLAEEAVKERAFANFTKLAEAVREHKGEPVLLAYSQEKANRTHPGLGQRSHYWLERHASYGLVTGDEIDFDLHPKEGQGRGVVVRIPAEGYFHDGSWQEGSLPVASSIFSMYIKGVPPDLGNTGNVFWDQHEPRERTREEEPHLKILFGDEIGKWMARQSAWDLDTGRAYLDILRMSAEIVIKPPEIPEEMREYFDVVLQHRKSELRSKVGELTRELEEMDQQTAEIAQKYKEKEQRIASIYEEAAKLGIELQSLLG